MTTVNVSSGGSTLEREQFSGDIHDWIIYILTAFFCLCGLVGNGKVIWILGLCLQRSYFTIYILNLAIADFGTLSFVLIRATSLPFYQLSDFTLSLLYSLFFFVHNASLYLLTTIAVERCFSVLFPVSYQRRRMGHLSALISFLLWAFSGLLSGWLFMFCLILSFEKYFTVVNIICCINLVIFTPVMVASTLTLFMKVCCYSRGRQPPRVYLAILLTLLCFITFAIPLSTVHIILKYSKRYSRLVIEIPILFASFNSGINPVIYYHTGRDWNRKCKESLKTVLQRVFKDEADSTTPESLG